MRRKWFAPRWSEPLRVTARTSHCVQLVGKGKTWFHLSACVNCDPPSRSLDETRVDLNIGQREGVEEKDTEEQDQGTKGDHTAPTLQCQQSSNTPFSIIEREGDLLEVPEHIAIGHCISADYVLGVGVAKQIKKKYGVEQLRKNISTPGQCVETRHGAKRIFHLVTKRWCRELPTYNNLEKSLGALRDKCRETKTPAIALPKIGCGRDKLRYRKVVRIIEEVFKDGDIQVILLTRK